MNIRAAGSMTEAQIEAILGGAAAPPVPPPTANPNPNPNPNPPACRDADGTAGVCKDVSTCDGIPKRGLCAGPTNIQCCLPRTAPAPGGPAVPGKCVQARQGVNVRSAPSTSNSQIRLLAFGGEQFTQVEESGGWLKITNPRGSGWSYGRFLKRI